MSSEDNGFGKTEWEDALIKHGIIKAPTPKIDKEDIYEAEYEANVNKEKDLFKKYEKATQDEQNVQEDELEEDVLETLRKRRQDTQKKQAARNKYGTVYDISEPDWKIQVTQAEKDVYVVVHLYATGKEECVLLDRILVQLATKYKSVKFVRIEGKHAIHNWPDTNCPAILVYYNGEIKLTKVGFIVLGGTKMSCNSIEWMLSENGIVETELVEDPLIAELQRMREKRIEEAKKIITDDDMSWLEQ